jgi:heme A synthase
MFVLIVIGSVVRTTGSGLACPDWPLCQGRLIPPFEPHVLIEWLHRTVALAASLLLLATAVWTLAHRATRRRLGGLVGLAVGLILVQILLGALTVWKLLHPVVVSSHLAVALLLFSTLLTLTLVAETEAAGEGGGWAPPVRRSPLLLPALGTATTLVFAQAVLGGVVSSQHAGLACPDWPTCNGEWFPPLQSLAGLQMFHRGVAYVLTAAMLAVAILTRSAPDPAVRAGGSMAFGLTLAQVVLGVCNVLLGIPPWVSALHIATATAILGMMVTVTFRAARIPAREGRLVPAGVS